jgi:hypothetical protein
VGALVLSLVLDEDEDEEEGREEGRGGGSGRMWLQMKSAPKSSLDIDEGEGEGEGEGGGDGEEGGQEEGGHVELRLPVDAHFSLKRLSGRCLPATVPTNTATHDAELVYLISTATNPSPLLLEVSRPPE